VVLQVCRLRDNEVSQELVTDVPGTRSETRLSG